MIAATDYGTSPLSTEGSAPGYTPNYQGIYILSPVSKKQTRLFDYIDLLRPEDSAEVVDIDQDGDDDYIYLLDGVVYVKYASRSDVPRPVDNDIVIGSPDMTLLPRAPDFFHEIVASPGQIEVSIYPANPEDRNFRLEFFDKYLEFDRVSMAG